MCHRLRSAEVLLGIISFSPAKGRGEATRLLMTVVFQRGCFPGGCAVFPQGFSPPGNQTLPTVDVGSRACGGAVAMRCWTCTSLVLVGSGHPSLSLLGYTKTQPCDTWSTLDVLWQLQPPGASAPGPLYAGRR